MDRTRTDRQPATQDPRPIVAVDWSRKVVHATFDGVAVEKFPSIDELIERLAEPHRIVAENTIESWETHKRAVLAERARSAGHEILVFRPLHTARARRRWEITTKNDPTDARVIHRIATTTRLHLYPLKPADEDWNARERAAATEYVRIRLDGEKATLIAEAKAILGPYGKLEGDIKVALGNGSGYTKSVLAAVYFAACRATNRADFERLLGLQGSGHPSILRSEIHLHGFAHRRKKGVEWPVFRRGLRQAFQAFKAAREAAPELALAA